MNTIKLIASRFIKLFANITKIFSYIFHFFLPKKRFTLPNQSAPLLKSSKQSRVPRIIWQTNFTNKATLPVYLNYLFNRIISPTFEYRFMITEDRERYIKEHFDGEIYNQYMRLQIGAAQADLWRLLVLYREGGVYLDIDAHAIWPLGYIIGNENDALYVEARRELLSNYFIASCAQNPDLKKIIDQVILNIKDGSLTNVFEITGPGVFNKVLDRNLIKTVSYRHACNQGSFTNEYFQYIDKPAGKWTKEQNKVSVVKKDQ